MASAVVLRLIDEQGGPVIKVAASEDGGGVVISNEENNYVQILARNTGSFIKINQHGKEQVMKQE